MNPEDRFSGIEAQIIQNIQQTEQFTSFHTKVSHWVSIRILIYNCFYFTDSILSRFSGYRDGRLVVKPIQTIQNVQRPEECASFCMKVPHDHCLSINFDFGPDRVCELLNTIDGDAHQIAKVSDTIKTAIDDTFCDIFFSI